MRLMVVFAAMALSFSAGAETKKINYGPCIKALNEKSVILKDRVYPLSADGHSFAYKNFEGNLIVVGEGGSYTLNKKPVKCTASTEFDSLSAMQSLVIMTTAFNNDPKNSEANKKEIVAKCKDFLNLPMKSSAPGATAPGGAR